jgi:3-isopropylmalate/(R)-2-methylmalate dehydratase small subunit
MSDAVIRSRTFNLPYDNVDTDQIYPARYLTVTSREGLGEYGFHDWRHNPESEKYPLFEAWEPERQRILVAGANFGCGSSREHAPWALLDMGFAAVIGTDFGDIFYSNSLKNGLLLCRVDADTVAWLLDHDATEVEINIAAKVLRIPGRGETPFPLDAFTAYCLARGIDAMDYLVGMRGRITAFEALRES